MSFPKIIKGYIEKNPLYIRLRYSKWMYQVWLLFRSDVKKEIREKNRLYKSIFPTGCKLIFDIGANEGVLTDIFSRIAKKVIAAEPADRNIKILSARFSNHKFITIIPAAISNLTGEQVWFEDLNNYAMGTLSSKWNESKEPKEALETTYISTITLDDLIKNFGVPDYIKIDIEGHEWQALQGLSKPVPLLSFEAMLPQFLDETIMCIERISAVLTGVTFNYLVENKFAYSDYQKGEKILNDLQYIQQTIDIFCKQKESF